ncbi:MAG: rRNA maturation RNase YbeY [Oscillospiraceae bacterium]|nr:rRNA maturation RNase YbeY [Oscillospiraceae bacterium]
MIKHIISIQFDDDAIHDDTLVDVIERAVLETLRFEVVDLSCVVNVLVTFDDGIRRFNLDFRELDSATDVLSFPMQEFSHSGWSGRVESDFDIDLDTGELPLGDIVISIETVKRQAEEYVNTFEYETAYMIVHSTLHLLGYDHDNEVDEEKMNSKKQQLMKELGYIK